MDNSQWFLHLKRITCIEREVKQSLKVKMFATFMFPLFNIKDISMFLSTPSLPDTIIVAFILEGTGWFSNLFASAPLKIILGKYVAIAHFELKSKYFIITVDFS